MGVSMMEQFAPSTVDKVERLMDYLERMTTHPVLKGRFAMYGGTAINLFMLGVPRLSVDIDATYVGSPDRDEMLAIRPRLEEALSEIARELGYSIKRGRKEHAGRTFYLGYTGEYGPDNVKIDFTYLDRVPLIPVSIRTTMIRDGLEVPAFSDAELVGGKAKAYFSRVKVRDLYDISNISHMLDEVKLQEQRQLFHKVILYDAALSAAFPFGFDGREQRFADKQRELESELYPMLRAGTEKPTLGGLMNDAASFTSEWVLPQNDVEQEFLDRFASGDFAPALLFGEGDMASSASVSPEAAWKLANLKKMKV